MGDLELFIKLQKQEAEILKQYKESPRQELLKNLLKLTDQRHDLLSARFNQISSELSNSRSK
jgi:hypothetical protein